jgi:phosphoribosylglycinamide formyltransferase-1
VTARSEPLRVGVLASGRGSNLQAILDATRVPDYPARVVVVISDRERAAVLDRARAAGVDAVFLNPKDFGDREAYDGTLVRELESRHVGLVACAGYMRILSPAFVQAFAGRLLNIHPSLLPAFPGLHPQRQALAAGVKISGATVHFMDEGVDTGPIIAQTSVPVRDGDTEDSLAERIVVEEHRLYPDVIRWIAEGRVTVDGRKVTVAR